MDMQEVAEYHRRLVLAHAMAAILGQYIAVVAEDIAESITVWRARTAAPDEDSEEWDAMPKCVCGCQQIAAPHTQPMREATTGQVRFANLECWLTNQAGCRDGGGHYGVGLPKVWEPIPEQQQQ